MTPKQNCVSGLIGRAMPHDRDSPHHAAYKDAHHIRGSISQGESPSLSRVKQAELVT